MVLRRTIRLGGCNSAWRIDDDRYIQVTAETSRSSVLEHILGCDDRPGNHSHTYVKSIAGGILFHLAAGDVRFLSTHDPYNRLGAQSGEFDPQYKTLLAAGLVRFCPCLRVVLSPLSPIEPLDGMGVPVRLLARFARRDTCGVFDLLSTKVVGANLVAGSFFLLFLGKRQRQLVVVSMARIAIQSTA